MVLEKKTQWRESTITNIVWKNTSFEREMLCLWFVSLFYSLLLQNIGYIFGVVQYIPEKAMAPHSNTLAWKVPWTEEPDGWQSMGSRRVRHNWVTSLSCIGEGNGNPLQCSGQENPRDGGAWWAAVQGSHRVRHNWSDLAVQYILVACLTSKVCTSHSPTTICSSPHPLPTGSH